MFERNISVNQKDRTEKKSANVEILFYLPLRHLMIQWVRSLIPIRLSQKGFLGEKIEGIKQIVALCFEIR